MRVAVYARVSTSDKGQDTEVQLAPLRDYCRNRQWETQEFVDEGMSGARHDRPALNNMMAAVRRRQVKAVVVWKLDRLGRSLKHLLQLVEDMHNSGCDFISITETIDTTTAQGRLVFQLMGALAEFERALIRERVFAGLANAKRHGKRLGAPKKSAPETVRVLRAQGLTVQQVAQQLGVTERTVQRYSNGGDKIPVSFP